MLVKSLLALVPILGAASVSAIPHLAGRANNQQIYSGQDNLCLGTSSSDRTSLSDGTQVISVACNSVQASVFVLTSGSGGNIVIDDGGVSDTKLALDAENNNLALRKSSDGAAYQTWTWSQDDNTIKLNRYGLCLTEAENGVTVGQCTGGPEQVWYTTTPSPRNEPTPLRDPPSTNSTSASSSQSASGSASESSSASASAASSAESSSASATSSAAQSSSSAATVIQDATSDLFPATESASSSSSPASTTTNSTSPTSAASSTSSSSPSISSTSSARPSATSAATAAASASSTSGAPTSISSGKSSSSTGKSMGM
ncbi:hypothetical protein CI109_100027 [Kwoniella shandongensis]|uniref:Ricin B lectin domain-containing protein n=1 Tax=Kwoniella shandongensis TaxID=1734106 RepID=A0AAJ8MS70_9TREE